MNASSPHMTSSAQPEAGSAPLAVNASQLRNWLSTRQEIALLDVREHGQFGEGHPLFAVNTPYSRLESVIGSFVPRLSTRVVLLDDADDGLARLAARRLSTMGYADVAVLAGGAQAWRNAGHALFQGVNVPSKTFGELVEQSRHTPSLAPEALRRRLDAGEPLLLLDGRTPAEHERMTIPGAIPLPNGELAARIGSVLANDHTPIVVHCAGRTRSIIGAQTLRDLGLPNPVFALENGTQGWRLAGFELEHGSTRSLPPLHQGAELPAREPTVRDHAHRHGVRHLAAAEARAWLDDPRRTTYVFDVRTDEEYGRQTLGGARHAPGGQLVQATDLYIGVRASRVLLLDDDGLRAPVVAGWLRQMGYEAATVEGGIHACLRLPEPPAAPRLATLPRLAGAALASRLQASPANHALLDIRTSGEYRQRHTQGARWAIRPRLDPALPPGTRSATLVSNDATLASLVARDLHERGIADVSWASQADLDAIGHPTASSPDCPGDGDAIDYLFFTHDRHDGNLDAARRYLIWETGLIGQCQPWELALLQPD